MVAGWLAAPLITSPGASLVGVPGAPSLTAATAAEVIGVALAGCRLVAPSARASAVEPAAGGLMAGWR